MAELHFHIVAYCRKARSLKIVPEHGDFRAAVKENPHLLEQAHAEKQRLEDENAALKGGSRGLFERDVESRDRHRALQKMIIDATKETVNA